MRYRDGKTKLTNGRWKVFTVATIDKDQRIEVDGKWRTAKWIANRLKNKVMKAHLLNVIDECDPSLSIETLIDGFLKNCQNANRSPMTIDNYRFNLNRMLTEGKIDVLGKFTVDNLIAWRDKMCTYLKSKTVRERLVTAHTFAGWLLEAEKIKAIPFRKSMIPKVTRSEPKYYTTEDWIALDDAAGRIVPANARLAFNLAYSAGLRFVEVCGNKYKKGIQWDDFRWNLDGSVDLTIREEVSKSGPGVIHLDRSVIALLGSRKKGPVITLERRAVWHLFTKCRKAIGKPKLTIHRLRHSFVKNILERGGGDLGAAKEAARHADIKTTQIYAHHEKSHIDKIIDRTYEIRIQEEAIARLAGHPQGRPNEIIEPTKTETTLNEPRLSNEIK